MKPSMIKKDQNGCNVSSTKVQAERHKQWKPNQRSHPFETRRGMPSSVPPHHEFHEIHDCESDIKRTEERHFPGLLEKSNPNFLEPRVFEYSQSLQENVNFDVFNNASGLPTNLICSNSLVSGVNSNISYAEVLKKGKANVGKKTIDNFNKALDMDYLDQFHEMVSNFTMDDSHLSMTIQSQSNNALTTVSPRLNDMDRLGNVSQVGMKFQTPSSLSVDTYMTSKGKQSGIAHGIWREATINGSTYIQGKNSMSSMQHVQSSLQSDLFKDVSNTKKVKNPFTKPENLACDTEFPNSNYWTVDSNQRYDFGGFSRMIPSEWSVCYSLNEDSSHPGGNFKDVYCHHEDGSSKNLNYSKTESIEVSKSNNTFLHNSAHGDCTSNVLKNSDTIPMSDKITHVLGRSPLSKLGTGIEKEHQLTRNDHECLPQIHISSKKKREKFTRKNKFDIAKLLGNQTAKEMPQSIYKSNEVFCNLHSNSKNEKESMQEIKSVSKNRRKKLSKLKKQNAFQKEKLHILTPELYSRYIDQTSSDTVNVSQFNPVDINNSDEYPELQSAFLSNNNQESSWGKGTSYRPTQGSNATIVGNCEINIVKDFELLKVKDVDVYHHISTNDRNMISNPKIYAKAPQNQTLNAEDAKKKSKAHVGHGRQESLKLLDLWEPKPNPKTDKEFRSMNQILKIGGTKNFDRIQSVNALDSTAPSIRRGKEREKPKQKKLTHMKKLILGERKQRRDIVSSLDRNRCNAADTNVPQAENVNTTFEDIQNESESLDESSKVNFQGITSLIRPMEGSPSINNNEAMAICKADTITNESGQELGVVDNLHSKLPKSDFCLSEIHSSFDNDNKSVTSEQINQLPGSVDLESLQKGLIDICMKTTEQYDCCYREAAKEIAVLELDKCIRFALDYVNRSIDENVVLEKKGSFYSVPKTASYPLFMRSSTRNDPILYHFSSESATSTQSSNNAPEVMQGEMANSDQCINDIGTSICEKSYVLENVHGMNQTASRQTPPTKYYEDEQKWKNINIEDRRNAVKIFLHSRNFREYCQNFISTELDEKVLELLQDLSRFQDRMYQKDPRKAYRKRRLVNGIKEVSKYLTLKKLKCVVIAPNVENVKAEGGLNDILSKLIQVTGEYHIPCIFALCRIQLGKASHKPVGVSCIGVVNFEGAEANYKKMIELHEESSNDYKSLCRVIYENLEDCDIKELIYTKCTAPQNLSLLCTNIAEKMFSKNQINKSAFLNFNTKYKIKIKIV